ncbi:MAG: polyribonucleotide nucleotidyltransferase [Candidatus Microthrix subdominans]|jgi:polyribonucleotide nucleotidyltransferase|uniref:polyribonucleotide nucleotidyltransferase n=1 Tax=Candidatus Neomicrothrix sp. TaxID=2719034 RepID=UPI001E129216|nr:polyribonucleotide nucleotidyltransferase [Candidatus Microthrix sp.]MBK6310037.1 polyribonucleotide nucleotidyltransferase [Candidatus Microthrix sp.]MBK6439240.1 polyribonucleotide nucleotidyltransferase [Candidatus Microthrix sp.]HMS46617.1 polyribonucleotide nucleotidyltransferase [Candidatus Microthrix sp.]
MVTTPIEGALRVRATVADDPAGDKEVTMEAGRLASLADGSVLVGLGDTRVLVTATASRRVREGADFFPLTVDIEERSYAAGKIPGSFFRREGRASEAAILTDRLIDRPLRPSFPSTFRNEVHVVGLVLGADQENPYDVLALNGASAALMLSGIPFEGPVGAVRLSYSADGEWLPHPTYAESDAGSFDMVVAGRQLDGSDGEPGDIAVMMVEAGGTEGAWELYEEGAPKVDEEALAAGLEASKAHIAAMIDLQRQLVEVHHETHGTPEPIAWVPQVDYTPEVADAVAAAAGDRISETAAIADKAERTAAEAALRDDLVAQVAGAADEAERGSVEKQAKAAFRAATKEAVRSRIVNEGARIDGRGPADLRPLSSEVGVIPTAHGTGLFQRGETQVMNITTLGIGRMDQMIDGIDPVTKKRYMHHYNFPPFSTGEPGFMRGPKRREIGHGALAEKAVFPLVPSMAEFPYTIRLVSEVLSSNGSTSMASVCASSLSLMDAGVPLRAPVAGIAMGLVYADGKYTTLTDILGAEDAFGDMDFKVAGTAEFVTALQLDTKIEGIPADVLIDALNQAKDARMAILDNMTAALPAPRPEVNETAPKIISFEIPADKIGEVIGPKGKVINSIQGETGADISVDDDGMVGIVSVSAVDGGAVAEAERQIRLILDPPTPEVNAEYTGKVVSITKFGAFINILPGRDGLLHISKIGGGKRIDKVEDVLELGQDLQVYVEDIDPNGKVSLRMVGDTKADSAGKGSGSRSSGERGDSPKADAPPRGRSSATTSSATGSDASTADDARDSEDTGSENTGTERPQRAPEFAPVLEAKLTETYGDLGPEPAPRNAGGGRRGGSRGGRRGR